MYVSNPGGVSIIYGETHQQDSSRIVYLHLLYNVKLTSRIRHALFIYTSLYCVNKHNTKRCKCVTNPAGEFHVSASQKRMIYLHLFVTYPH